MRTVDRRELAAVFAGGCLGALARAGLTEWANVAPGEWPWPTFVANLVGSALLGFVAAHAASDAGGAKPVSRIWGPGFCGALTTFATLQVEVLDLADAGRSGLAGAYVAASVAAGLAAIALGRRLA